MRYACTKILIVTRYLLPTHFLGLCWHNWEKLKPFLKEDILED